MPWKPEWDELCQAQRHAFSFSFLSLSLSLIDDGPKALANVKSSGQSATAAYMQEMKMRKRKNLLFGGVYELLLDGQNHYFMSD